MQKLIQDKAGNKRIVILGFGMEGQSSLHYLLSLNISNRILVADQNPEVKSHPLLQANHIEVLTGKDYLSWIHADDFIIKSPGVQLRRYRPELSSHSQTSLFLEKYGSQIIGITGTKGKSTTSTMMFKILKAQNKKAFLVGNIGQPAFDMISQIADDSWIVYELSAHQLQCVKQGPRMAILLNLMPEHLDYFNTVDEYYHAKLHLFANQTPPSFAFIHEKTKNKVECSIIAHPPLNSELRDQQLYLRGESILSSQDLIYLLGHHHLENIQALIELVLFLKLDLDEALNTIKDFHPLPHRQELLGEKNGIRFVNDSISTIPESAIQAVNAIKNVDYLILGGLDRGIDYSLLAEFLGRQSFSKVYFLGKAGKSILNELRENEVFMHFRFQWNESLYDLEDELLQLKSGTVLLSPAAASYDHFKNFEERGDYFRHIFSKI